MSFEVAAGAYDRFMGRYSTPLAPELADFAQVSRGQSVLDVGCGPGALTAELVRRVGPPAVSAVDPSEQFVAAARQRFPEVTIRNSRAEDLPFASDTFDTALAQLVVHFMDDPVAGLREMARVTVDGGVVAACVWDHAGAHGPLSTFWSIARETAPEIEDESELPGTRQGHLVELFDDAGLHDVEEDVLAVLVEHPSFDDWWEPFTLGVGPAGAYVAGLAPQDRDALEERCRRRLTAPFVLEARAWAARGRA